jgi:hypothetical protein
MFSKPLQETDSMHTAKARKHSAKGFAECCPRQRALVKLFMVTDGRQATVTANLSCTHPAHNKPCRLRYAPWIRHTTKFKCFTRPETICPGTSKLVCWRVQLSTASKVGRRGAGTATASIEASLLTGDISDPPAKMVPFMLADELCRQPA